MTIEQMKKEIEKLEVTECWTDDKYPSPYKEYSKECLTKSERFIKQIDKQPVLDIISKHTKGKVLIDEKDLLTEEESNHVEYCVIMDNSTIENVYRLEESLIGRNAKVIMKNNKNVVRLNIGDYSIVEI